MLIFYILEGENIMNLKLKIRLEKIRQEKKMRKNILIFILFLICLIFISCLISFINHHYMIINTDIIISSNEIINEEDNMFVCEQDDIVSVNDNVVAPDNIIIKQKEIDKRKILNDILESNKKLSNDYATTLAYNIVNIADVEGINPYLLAAVIKTESNYNQNVKSNADAVGLGQLTKECTNEIQERTGTHYNRYNSIENIQCCAKYLSLMTKKFHNEDLVLAAYNAGETIVAKNNSIPDIRETKHYVIKVHKAMDNY